LPFAYPVAVKALSAAIAHKTEAGGVILNVGGEAELSAAIRKIKAATNAPRVLIQPMVSGLGEVLIGYRVDGDVGPMVMLAAGGILAEIMRDRSLRLAPVDLPEAKAMIAEVASLRALAGYRGRPEGDLAALAQALVALSQLAIQNGPAVAEAEVNPLMVMPRGHGVVAVDALVRLT
jgi:acyl-CoA synthetase (NDP forming)